MAVKGVLLNVALIVQAVFGVPSAKSVGMRVRLGCKAGALRPRSLLYWVCWNQ